MSKIELWTFLLINKTVILTEKFYMNIKFRKEIVFKATEKFADELYVVKWFITVKTWNASKLSQRRDGHSSNKCPDLIISVSYSLDEGLIGCKLDKRSRVTCQ